MCLYIRERIRLARDADSIFIIIIIIFNTSRTCSRIYYIVMRSAVGIVLAILYYIITKTHTADDRAAAEAMTSGRRHPLSRGSRNANVDGTSNIVITIII